MINHENMVSITAGWGTNLVAVKIIPFQWKIEICAIADFLDKGFVSANTNSS